MNRLITKSFLAMVLVWSLVMPVSAECPSADLTRDCFVDLADFAVLAGEWLEESNLVNLVDMSEQWLTGSRLPDDMVDIPGGTFAMGDSFGEVDSDERPVHTVTVSTFAMGKFEITNAQYCAYLNSALNGGTIYVSSGLVYGTGNNKYYCDTSTSSGFSQIAYSGGVFMVQPKSGRNMTNDPMVRVSWYGAVAYCNWRSQQEGREPYYTLSGTWPCDFNKKGYRLPTEAEWEYAARGGLAGRRFPWSNTINQTQANFKSSSSYVYYDVSPVKNQYHPIWNDGVYPYTSPVGFFDGSLKYKTNYNWPGSATSYQTANGGNGYGLYDMAGNVWEWCNDWYGVYSSSSQTNPTGPTSGSVRVIRGGSWDLTAYHCRVAFRNYGYLSTQSDSIGFRVVLDFQ